MATFGELGNKITKQLGKYEKDLKSTEPDLKVTAQRMIPRLQGAMQELMQGQELFKAQRTQRDMAKMANGGVPTYQTGGYVKGTWASRPGYSALTNYDYEGATYEGTDKKSAYLPNQSVKDMINIEKRTKKIFSDMAAKYPDSNGTYSPEQLKEAGYADEYYDMYDYRSQYNDTRNKIKGTAGDDEFGQGDTTPLLEQQIGPRHHEYFNVKQGKTRTLDPVKDAEQIAFQDNLNIPQKQWGGPTSPYADTDSTYNADVVNPIYEQYGTAAIPKPNPETQKDFHYETDATRAYDAQWTQTPMETPVQPQVNASTNAPDPELYAKNKGWKNNIYTRLPGDPVSFMDGLPGIYEPFSQTSPEEFITLQEAAQDVDSNGDPVVDNKNKPTYTRPKGISSKADLTNFQQFVYEQDRVILGSTGVDSLFGGKTAAAWQKYGDIWSAIKKGGEDPAEAIKIKKMDALPLAKGIRDLVKDRKESNPYMPQLESVGNGNRKGTKFEGFLIDYLGFPEKSAAQYEKMYSRQDKRNAKREAKGNKKSKNSEEHFATNILNIDKDKMSNKQKKGLTTILNKLKKKQEDVELDRSKPKELTQEQVSAMPKYKDPNLMDQIPVQPADIYSQANIGGHYRDANSMPTFRNGGQIPKLQDGDYLDEDGAPDWGAVDDQIVANPDQYEDLIANSDYYDDSLLEDPEAPTGGGQDWNKILQGGTKLVTGYGKGTADLDALKYANPSGGPIEYAEGRQNPMGMAYMQRLKEAEGMQNDAWAKSQERRDYKVRPELVAANREYEQNKTAAQHASGPMRHLLTQSANARLNDKRGAIRTKEQNTEAQWNDPRAQAQMMASISGQRGALGAQYGGIGSEMNANFNQMQNSKLMTDAAYRGLLSADYVNSMNFQANQQQMNNQAIRDQQALEAIKAQSNYKGTQDFVGGQ